jgi:hypothetical protein
MLGHSWESELDQNDASGKIDVQFRVGITGHRSLPDHARVAADIAIALERILALQSVHGTDSTPVGLTIVSALAEGADRILVQQARLIRSCRLEAILPMPAEQYLKDFATQESRDTFTALLGSAETTLVVGSAQQRPHGYELAGRAIVDRSDVLIAVLDEHRTGSAGGTASTVAYARARRVPLFWVHLDGTNRITTEWGDGDATSSLPSMPISQRAFEDIDRFNRRSIPSRFSAVLVDLPASYDPGTESHLVEFVRWATPYWRRAEANARGYRLRSLTAVRILSLLAIAAVGIATVALAFHLDTRWIWVEALLLIVIAAVLMLLWWVPSWHWHEKWIANRSLAERLRSAAFLGVAGVNEQLEAGMAAGNAPNSGDEWLSRAYQEVWFRRPHASIHKADLGALQTLLAEVWLAGQIQYHAKVATRHERISEGLRAFVLILFALSIVVVVLDGVNRFGAVGRSWLGLLAVAIPSLAAAASGYGGQREFSQLADRSRRTEARLTETRRHVCEVDSLDAMQTLALTAEQQLRGETADWYSLVRLHKPDVPA